MTWTDPNYQPEKQSIQHYLHEYTYPDLQEASVAVIDSQGILWAGPNRKGLNMPNPVDLWKRWQKDVQFAGRIPGHVPKHVEAYFQRTKNFSRPPKNGEIGMDNKPITVENKPVAPVFTWSPTKLQAFETCPFQFAAQYYYKTLPYQETTATIWGNRVHAAAELYLKTGQIVDEEAFKPVEKYVKVIDKMSGIKYIEDKLSVDSKLQPCEYEQGEGRMIADVYIKDGDSIWIGDWKTGRVKDDEFQLKTYALLLFIKHPDVQKITYKYIWVKDGVITGGELLRSELVPVAKDLMGKLKTVKDAWDNENFPKKKNGLCRQWCGVSECPNCGR